MTDDLRALLRSADGPPSHPDHADIQRRGRRLMVTRAVSAAAAVIVVVAGVAGVASLLGPGDDLTPPAIDEPPRPSTDTDDDPGDDPERDPGDADDRADDDPGAADTPGSLTPADTGRALLVAGADGVRRVDGQQSELLWDGAARQVVSDGRGGVVLVEPSDPPVEGQPWGFDTIRWLPAGAGTPEPSIADSDDRATLHAVVDRDGEPTALFTRRTGDLDGPDVEGQEERMFAHALGSGTETDLGVTGGLESGAGDAALAGDQLVVSRCHLQCSLEVFASGSVTDGDGRELEPSGPHHGLAARGDLVAHVTSLSSGPPSAEEPVSTVLVLHELGVDRRREIELPAIDLPADQLEGVEVDLAGDGDAAIVQFRARDGAPDVGDALTLFVDDLTTEPVVSHLDVDGSVAFDVAGDGSTDAQVTAADEALAASFLEVANAPGPETLAGLPLDAEAALGLGQTLVVTRDRAELADPTAWEIDAGPNGYNGYIGPFSALDVASGARDTVVSVGDHPHCASPPVPPPDEVADLRRVSVQPDPEAVESCLQWWTVDLFVADDGSVTAITLDLYEP